MGAQDEGRRHVPASVIRPFIHSSTCLSVHPSVHPSLGLPVRPHRSALGPGQGLGNALQPFALPSSNTPGRSQGPPWAGCGHLPWAPQHSAYSCCSYARTPKYGRPYIQATRRAGMRAISRLLTNPASPSSQATALPSISE